MSRSLTLRLNQLIAITVGALLIVVGTGCDLGGGAASSVTVSGRVVDASSNPVQNAQVTFRFTDASDEEVEKNTLTDSLGTFSETLEVEETTEVTITAAKGEVSADKSLQVSPDAGNISDLSFGLSFGDEEEREPGRPTDILLQSQSTDAIQVQESGGTTVARLMFQVVDSTGQAIDLDQAVDVNFRFGQRPDGATLTPETVTTDGSGQATVNVSSGTTAGVVQIVAQTQRPDGTEFQSKPVALTIHGGLPNKCHFSLGPGQFNFAGLTEFGLTNSVRVFVGDKFGNPVVPGTSVYFSTNAGIIGGSTQTGDQGRGEVTLTSAQPLPNSGVATIRAETVGTNDVNTIVDPDNCPDPAETGNENTISKRIPVLFSGRPEIRVTPSTAELGRTYDLTVRDAEHGNPLAPGTTIQVEAEGTKVKATGNTDVTLGDTDFGSEGNNGFGPEDITNEEDVSLFTFRVVEDQETDETGTPTIETVTITVEGPNGSLEVVLTPSSPSSGEGSAASSQSLTPTRGATVLRPSSGKVIVRAPEGR